MKKTTTCTVRVLNKSYGIKCSEDEVDHLNLAVQKLNARLQDKKSKFKNLDEFQSLLLAALHLSYDLIQCESEQEQQRSQLTKFMSSLEHTLGQVTRPKKLSSEE